MSEYQPVAYYSPSVSIDCVIFGFHQSSLKVLILKYRNTEVFALPGGFINEEEDLEDAAKRILENRTNLCNIYLEQFGVFGKTNRVNSDSVRGFLNVIGLLQNAYEFFKNRFVSIGYFSLVDFTALKIAKDEISASLEWFDVDNVPTLMHDHNEIIQKARETLISQLSNKAVGVNLMPEQFTMSELQNLHEAILGTTLTRTNFQRKMLSLGFLDRIEKKFTGKAHKAPYLYRFK